LRWPNDIPNSETTIPIDLPLAPAWRLMACRRGITSFARLPAIDMIPSWNCLTL
jgi:hypothetical protein